MGQGRIGQGRMGQVRTGHHPDFLYIGSSVNLRHRWANHKSDCKLRKGHKCHVAQHFLDKQHPVDPQFTCLRIFAIEAVHKKENLGVVDEYCIPLSGVVDEYCIPLSGVVDEYCIPLSGVVDEYCIPLSGVVDEYCIPLSGVVDEYCIPLSGVVDEYCIPLSGVVDEYCIPLSGVVDEYCIPLSGVVDEYCIPLSGVVDEYCIPLSGVVDEYCIPLSGVVDKYCIPLSGVVDEYCIPLSGVVDEYCIPLSGVVDEYCIPLSGVVDEYCIPLLLWMSIKKHDPGSLSAHPGSNPLPDNPQGLETARKIVATAPRMAAKHPQGEELVKEEPDRGVGMGGMMQERMQEGLAVQVLPESSVLVSQMAVIQNSVLMDLSALGGQGF
ncbi:hypothetical protein ACOMHN_052932 [Nucella lapillus]